MYAGTIRMAFIWYYWSNTTIKSSCFVNQSLFLILMLTKNIRDIVLLQMDWVIYIFKMQLLLTIRTAIHHHNESTFHSWKLQQSRKDNKAPWCFVHFCDRGLSFIMIENHIIIKHASPHHNRFSRYIMFSGKPYISAW